MTNDIKIKAQPSADRSRCEFQVDRPVLEGGAAFFKNDVEAESSALAKALMAIPGITAVSIAGSNVILHRRPESDEDWLPAAKEAGARIRESLQSGQPAVDPAYLATKKGDGALLATVQDLLDREINPMVASHGGVIEVIRVEGQDLYLKMGGGCQGCGSATATLRAGVERLLRERIPTLGTIHDATDHEAGQNPYFAR